MYIDDGKLIFLGSGNFSGNKIAEKKLQTFRMEEIFFLGKFLFPETKQKIIFQFDSVDRTEKHSKLDLDNKDEMKNKQMDHISIQIFFLHEKFCWKRKIDFFRLGEKQTKQEKQKKEEKQWLQSFKLRKIFEYLK